MQIQNKLIEGGGIFFIAGKEENILLAQLTYSSKQPDTMIIEHTEVSDELRGQNIGYQLVHHAVEHAREHYLKIIAVCTFANSVINKKPAFKDVLAK